MPKILFTFVLFFSSVTIAFAQQFGQQNIFIKHIAGHTLSKEIIQADSAPCPPIPYFSISAVPSPFTVSTLISFELPSSGFLAVRIYDISGHVERTLASAVLDSGWHHIRWNGASDNGTLLPSGYYTCIASGLGKSDFVKIDLIR